MHFPRSESFNRLAFLFVITLILCGIHGSRAEAMRIVDVPGADGRPFLRYQLYDKGEASEEGTTSGFTLNDAEIGALVEGSKYWTTMLTPGALFSEPLLISLVTVDEYDDNASAGSEVYADSGYTELTAGIRGLPVSGILAQVTVDHAKNFNGQWYTEPMSSLPRNGEHSDLPSTLTHELNHAVGLSASVGSDDTGVGYGFADTGISLWTQGLRDINGNPAQPGQSITVADEAEPGAFVTNNLGTPSGVYFTGDHVREVLHGALLAAVADQDQFRVPGLPVNGWEPNYDENNNIIYFPEFSHIELQNSLMSHQAYRNWNILMEAELAAMQDVGLVLDRRNYFGFSIYNDGLTFDNTNPYYARNTEGWIENTYNPTDYGIGFHVYGSKNSIQQSADILSSGAWGMGIRMDGSGNALTIAPGVRVYADGSGSNALLVAYGSGHRVTQRGDLQALGTGGVAARFDFGSNEMGDLTEYRGSYIRSSWENDQWNPVPLQLSALQGPLVESFDVTGRLAGTDAAIFISPNAFVKNINLMSGASLSGDVVSAWDPYSHHVQYAGNREDLLTSLTFGLQADAAGQATSQPDALFRLRYAGDIRGEASLRLRVAGGLLAYDGTATVRDVTISEGAILGGNGIYTINPAGTFLNQGTLSPGNSIGALTVNGKYEQSPSGTLAVEFDSTGRADTLHVRGDAAIAGTLAFMPARGYYAGSLSLAPLDVSGTLDRQYSTRTELVSPTLTLRANPQSDQTVLISATREANAYSQYADSDVAGAIGRVLSREATPQLSEDMQHLVTTLDFSSPKGTDVQAGLAELAPDVYGNGVAAQFDMHRMLSDLLLADMGLRGMHPEASRPDGEWRTFMLPFAGNASRSAHDGLGGFDVSHAGLIGGAERITADGLTLGGHVAFNHQNMDNDRSGRLRGEGLYLGVQGRYAPESWTGWNIFGVGRVGMENMRAKRDVTILDYQRSNSKDWTGYSGTLRGGLGYDHTFAVFSVGVFASLDYAFMALPSFTEQNGLGSRLHLSSGTFQSLRSSVGTRVSTKPSTLNEHATWKVQGSVAWNHELLGKAGTLQASFADVARSGFTQRVELPGKDSLGLGAALIIDTDRDISFSLNAGSELAHGGSSLYGNLAVGWKF